ncbi:hypothetical protein GZH78_23325 [Pseudomonas fluorescens]|nr:hypothetical protein GZH78_23325 [Pseudomonas fluorescens]
MKLRKATEYPVDTKDDSDLRHGGKKRREACLNRRQKKIRKSSLSWAFQTFKTAKMVGRVGFEPTTNWLKANCSTN